MTHRIPPDEITQLMQFIAEKAKNVKSPMNIRELCRQFKEESGTSVSEPALHTRILSNRKRIHKTKEFDMKTKVKMMFALSAPIDAAFLIELKKVANVEVDEQQRITKYKQKDGKLELTATYLRLSMNVGEDRNKNILQLLAEKTETVDTPISDTPFLREFKARTGCPDSFRSLLMRYLRVKKTIFKSSEFDKNTKVKMIFLSHTQLSDNILEELRQDADVEVDERGRITKYKAKDGSLEVERTCEKPSLRLGRWQREHNIDLFKFLIEKTKNATYPLKIDDFSRDFKKEFNVSGRWGKISSRIRRTRPHIFYINQFDMHTKIKMLFALSARIDVNLLKKLQKDAIVGLDYKRRIGKYESKDGSLELERDCSWPAVVKGRKSDRTATSSSSSSVRRSERIKNRMSGGRKRARYPYSSSEESEDESSEEEEDDDIESMKSANDAPMDSDTSRVNNGGHDFDYDLPNYHQDNEDDFDYEAPIHHKENMKHAPTEPNSEVTSDKKVEAGPSTSVKINTMSLLEFLTHLRRPVIKMKVPFYASKIDSEIEKLKEKDRQIPINTIIESLQLFLQILKTPDEMDSDEETAPFSEVLHYLELSVCYITHPSMNEFQRES